MSVVLLETPLEPSDCRIRAKHTLSVGPVVDGAAEERVVVSTARVFWVVLMVQQSAAVAFVETSAGLSTMGI